MYWASDMYKHWLSPNLCCKNNKRLYIFNPCASPVESKNLRGSVQILHMPVIWRKRKRPYVSSFLHSHKICDEHGCLQEEAKWGRTWHPSGFRTADLPTILDPAGLSWILTIYPEVLLDPGIFLCEMPSSMRYELPHRVVPRAGGKWTPRQKRKGKPRYVIISGLMGGESCCGCVVALSGRGASPSRH